MTGRATMPKTDGEWRHLEAEREVERARAKAAGLSMEDRERFARSTDAELEAEIWELQSERARLEKWQAFVATLLRKQRLNAAREKLRERFAHVVAVNADRSSAALADALVESAGHWNAANEERFVDGVMTLLELPEPKGFDPAVSPAELAQRVQQAVRESSLRRCELDLRAAIAEGAA